MSQSRVEIKVGLFVLLGLILLAGLAVLFTRGAGFYRDTYELYLKSGNVGGIKKGASVLMRGVQIGAVSDTTLNPDGKGVTMTLKIKTKYNLYRDARFEIEQSGFLGDQFIAIYPGEDQGAKLANGDEVEARSPFNMQEAVAVATETIRKVGQVSSNIDEAVTEVRRVVLNQPTLQNFVTSLDRFAVITTEAQGVVSSLNGLISSNTLPVTAAVSNLNVFTSHLPPLADYIGELITNNGAEITTAIKNFEAGSATLTNLMANLQNGEGLAGRLLRDEKMASDLADIAYNLSITTSNLNTRGLWGILWKQKNPPPPRTGQPVADNK
jgi:phospholipid/cholesterol/gamma-HCH transport system substrate-binding protein